MTCGVSLSAISFSLAYIPLHDSSCGFLSGDLHNIRYPDQAASEASVTGPLSLSFL